MTDHYFPEDDPPDDDEVKYEAFDDVWEEPADELDAIDLDTLDDAIPEESGAPVESAAPDAGLLATLDTLDDAPEAEAEPKPPEPAPRKPSRRSSRSRASRPAAPDTAGIVEPPPDPLDTLVFPDLHQAPYGPPPVEETTSAPPAAPDDAAAPEAAPDVPTAPPAESPAILPGASVESGAPTGEPAPPPVPPEVYRVMLAVPPELGARVLELREAGEIGNMPPPGIALLPAFRTIDLPGVEAVLDDWTRVHLPLQLEITAVLAEVVGAQQYIAAWALQPEEDIQEAQYALLRALVPLILPLSDPSGAPVSAYPVRVTIGDGITARRYPHVIAQMQQDFEPFVWHAQSLLLARHLPEAGPNNWEIARTFD